MYWQNLLLLAYDNCVLDCEHSPCSRFGKRSCHFLTTWFFMILVQWIRPPSITIGSVQPLSASDVRRYIMTYAESVLTRRIL
jgi:hypothetical protein